MNTVRRQRGDTPWYAVTLAAWRKRADTGIRDALWAGAAWAARTVEFARAHPEALREIARLQDRVLAALSEDTAAVLLVMNERLAERERPAKAAGRPPASLPMGPVRPWKVRRP